MTPTLASLVIPFKLLFKIDINIWFAHTKFSPLVKFTMNYIADKWITVDYGQSFEAKCKRYIIGQGVDTDSFNTSLEQPKFDLITIGRISKSKNLEMIITALNICNKKYGENYTLSICGEAYTEEDKSYKKHIKTMIKKFALEDDVFFQGMVPRAQLHRKISESKVFIFTVPGGIGKATLEALSSGLPAILSSPEGANFLPKEMAKNFITNKNENDVAEKINQFLSKKDSELVNLGLMARDFIVTCCTFESFSRRVIEAIKDDSPTGHNFFNKDKLRWEQEHSISFKETK